MTFDNAGRHMSNSPAYVELPVRRAGRIRLDRLTRADIRQRDRNRSVVTVRQQVSHTR